MVDLVAIGVSVLQTYGLAGLAVVAFFSASLLPFPSEPIIVLASKYFDFWSIVAVVTVASTIAAYINYYVGLKGIHSFLVKRDPQGEHKAEGWFKSWGSIVLVVSPWVPFVGDLIPVAAGTLEMDWKKFLVLIVIARIIKTAAVVWFGQQLWIFMG
ncbi:SNARE associated Golgi protein [Candidatus Norongarragalina meridionalis]|nr:SNARE associated Golgi protein [Candidatus Norongarragalina meridionalis]